jgi:hypothetical protein
MQISYYLIAVSDNKYNWRSPQAARTVCYVGRLADGDVCIWK